MPVIRSSGNCTHLLNVGSCVVTGPVFVNVTKTLANTCRDEGDEQPSFETVSFTRT